MSNAIEHLSEEQIKESMRLYPDVWVELLNEQNLLIQDLKQMNEEYRARLEMVLDPKELDELH